jgi:DUF4097 and DUF4098 domain-containing protein YvlB
MNPNSLKRILVCAYLLLVGLMAIDARAADGSFEWQTTASEPFVLRVDTGSGSINVQAGSGDRVTVEGEIHLNRRFFLKPSNSDEIVQALNDNPPVEMTDGRLRVGYIKDRKIRRRVSISYDITVPAGTEVIADSGSGSIKIANIDAPVSAEAGSGSVKLENIGGPVNADTGSGSIRADGVDGAFNGSTGSGRIYLVQTAPGDVTVSTGSGSSELNGVVGSVRASAGSGSITIDGRQEGEWRIRTGSGSVRVTLPEDAGFDLEAESSSGGIEIDHPLTVEGRITRTKLMGKVRGGGPLLFIDTGSGGIRIR